MAEIKISVTKNGPYRVSGIEGLPRRDFVLNEEGYPRDWTEVEARELVTDRSGTAYLCRCGGSANKPYCDGTHNSIGFDGTETATTATYDEVAKVSTHDELQMGDEVALCAHAKFCQRRGDVWHLFAAPERTAQDESEMLQMMDQCPTGRLTHRATGSENWDEPARASEVFLAKNGPIMVTGGAQVERSDGAPVESRNRMALCRCGHSANKPFCDGSHIDAGFTDTVEE